MQNIIIVRKSFSVYWAEAMVGTGPHALLSVRPFIQSSLQRHLDCYTQTEVWQCISAKVRA